MLNLFKTNINKITKKVIKNTQKKTLKHFPTSVREWKNSIYVFNKNSLNVIPAVTIVAMNIIKGYFSIYNNLLERKMRKQRLLVRLRRRSSNKIYVSNGEFKHTNNNVLITLYLFNRQKHNYTLKLKKEYLKAFKVYNKRLNKKFSLIKQIGFEYIKEANNNINLITKIMKNEESLNNLNSKNFSDYINNFYLKAVKKSIAKLNMYMYFKQLLYINNSKYSYVFLQTLKKFLVKIFNKNVEFNLVNLKYFYLNSDILSESITLKITRNRRKILKYLNRLKRKVKIQKKNLLLHIFLKKKVLSFKRKFNNKLYLKNFILNKLKYRHVSGFRLEAKGRLTRRYTASRSAFKLRYKGNLMNIDSSFRGLSTVLLKGNLRSNVQYTKLRSKTRIGSFGIKGWVSGN